MAARKLSETQIELIVSMRERGVSIRRIAKEMGCSRGAASWHCLKHAADPPKGFRLVPQPVRSPSYRRGSFTVKRFTAAEDAKLLAMEAEGHSIGHIAKALRRNRNSILGRLMILARYQSRIEEAQLARGVSP